MRRPGRVSGLSARPTLSASLAPLFSCSTRVERLAVVLDAVGRIDARDVGTGAASDEVRFAVLGLYKVVALASDQDVTALAAVEFVVAVETPDPLAPVKTGQPLIPVGAAETV